MAHESVLHHQFLWSLAEVQRYFFASVQNKQGYHIAFARWLLNTGLFVVEKTPWFFSTMAEGNKNKHFVFHLHTTFTGRNTLSVCASMSIHTYIYFNERWNHNSNSFPLQTDTYADTIEGIQHSCWKTVLHSLSWEESPKL